jgi:hypothetical protein
MTKNSWLVWRGRSVYEIEKERGSDGGYWSRSVCNSIM